MFLWLFFALFFLLTAGVLGYFAWLPERLLAVHQYLTGRDAARELDRASHTFLRLTRRLCAVPALICIVIGVCFVKAAVQEARERPINEQHDQQRFEQIRRSGVGSLYSKKSGLLPPPPPAAPRAPAK